MSPDTRTPTGNERLSQQEQAERRQETEYRKRTFDQFIWQRGTRYRDCRLGNYRVTNEDQRAVLRRLADWAVDLPQHFDDGSGLVLFGPCGTGKDHLITGMVVEALKAGAFRQSAEHRIKWENGPTLFSKMRDAMGTEESEKQARGPYTAARLLILSDVCQAGHVLTDFQRQCLYDIGDRRYSNRRPTWITTNAASRDELETMIGEDLAERFLHDALVVSCAWKSYRRPA